jgi:DNA-binding FadR family transcriptional regulator
MRRKSAAVPAKASAKIHLRVAEQLGVAIVSGRHAPGKILLNEVEASEKLRVSRPAYREAMRMLAAKGLVRSRTKTGTCVQPRTSWHLLDPDVLAWMFHDEPDPGFVTQLFELRAIIEPAASALAAERRTAVQLQRLQQALEGMERNGLDTAEGRAADQAFHAEILTATGNEALMGLINSISASIRWTTMFKFRNSRKVRDSMPDHRRLYAAIVKGNAEAARKASLELVHLAHKDTQLTMRDSSRRKRQR